MSDYAVLLWPFLALGMLGGLAFLVWMSIPAARPRYTRSIAREQGLELDDEIAPLVACYYVRRMRLTALTLVAVLGMTALLAMGSASFSIEEAGGRFGGLLISFGIFVLSLGLLSVSISQLVRTASRRWQRRLHPELAKGATA